MHDKHTGNRIWVGTLGLILAVLITMGCSPSKTVTETNKTQTPGSYTVVGIGPGDSDLLTIRAQEAIQKADLVFCSSKTQEKLSPYVDFSGKQVLDGYGVLFRFYGRDCKQIDQGEKNFDGSMKPGKKKPGEPMNQEAKKPPKRPMDCEAYHQKQAEFAGLVRDAVKAGKHVVLLSGGDPTIYGPDMWSVKELKDLDPTVIPGLSAFNAANAALKVNLGEVVITAPFRKEGSKDSIEALAAHERSTMVIFMPRDMDELFGRLSSACSPDTPVAVVSNAGIVGQEKVAIGTINGLGADLSGIDRQRSIVYVGKPLANAQCKVQPSKTAGPGKYYLVGVGPGDADLITIRGKKVIESADLVFAHERLKDKFQDLLAGKEVHTGYHRLFPFYGQPCPENQSQGKSRERMSCEEYHKRQEDFAAMTRKAVAEGKTVVMLDSGDPLVYGPCSWSLTELSDINTEVVPGLSCFNAANAALKAGVTEGKSSHSVILASGWSVEEMAVHQSTMVLFTMRTDFKKFIDGLSTQYATDTPVAIVISAGYADREKVLHGTLGTILDQVGDGRLPFEYLLYVGDFLADGGQVAR